MYKTIFFILNNLWLLITNIRKTKEGGTNKKPSTWEGINNSSTFKNIEILKIYLSDSTNLKTSCLKFSLTSLIGTI